MEFRTVYSERKEKPGITFDKPTRTKQAFIEECDINQIMARYESTGIIDHLNPAQPIYGDASAIPDYREALEVVMNAEEAFMSLPATVRREFDNDPAMMLEFIQNPANRERCVELGLINADNSDDRHVSLPSDVVPSDIQTAKTPAE